MLTGDNGIMTQAKNAKQENKKGQLKEELELEIADLRSNKAIKGEELTQEEIIERINSIEGIVTGTTKTLIQGEYKDYEFEIDENFKVTIGAELIGVKPTAEIKILTTDKNVEKVELELIVSTTEGEIELVESLNGAIQKTETSSEGNRLYEVTQNGEYAFKIKGTNGRTILAKCVVSNIVEYNDILSEIDKIDTVGTQQIKVTGKINGKVEEKTYKLDVIIQKGNIVLDGKEIEGATFKDNIYQFGSTNDIGTDSTNAENTVVLKVDGDLTINEGITLTSVNGSYGGPKGMIVYCTGKLTNNGTISMSSRGAKASGENVYLFGNKLGSYEYVPANGANGATANATSTATYQTIYPNVSGANGTGRQTAGGASGGAGKIGSGVAGKGGNGGQGTSYSGGGGRRWNCNKRYYCNTTKCKLLYRWKRSSNYRKILGRSCI